MERFKGDSITVKPIKHGNSWYVRLPMEWAKAHDLVDSKKLIKVYEARGCLVLKPDGAKGE